MAKEMVHHWHAQRFDAFGVSEVFEVDDPAPRLEAIDARRKQKHTIPCVWSNWSIVVALGGVAAEMAIVSTCCANLCIASSLATSL